MARDIFCYQGSLICGFLYDKHGFSEARIICFNKKTLSPVWEHIEEDKVVYGGAVTHDGNTVWVCYDSRVICLSCQTGELIWQFNSEHKEALCNNSNCMYERIIVTEFHDNIHYMYCLDVKNGQIVWKTAFEEDCKEAYLSEDKKVFVISASCIYG